MKHVFCLFLSFVLLLGFLFALFCTEITFGGGTPAVWYREEGELPVISIRLPQQCLQICQKTEQFAASLPALFSVPCHLFFGAFHGVLADAKQIYVNERQATP